MASAARRAEKGRVMPRCANCNFNLELRDERALTPGECDACGAPVCYTCGCTEDRACVDVTGTPCSWEQLALGLSPNGQVGLGIVTTPGLCSSCFQRQAAEMYAAL